MRKGKVRETPELWALKLTNKVLLKNLGGIPVNKIGLNLRGHELQNLCQNFGGHG